MIKRILCFILSAVLLILSGCAAADEITAEIKTEEETGKVTETDAVTETETETATETEAEKTNASSTPETTAPEKTEPPETAPPETEPPETAPPETAPPETEPPETAPTEPEIPEGMCIFFGRLMDENIAAVNARTLETQGSGLYDVLSQHTWLNEEVLTLINAYSPPERTFCRKRGVSWFAPSATPRIRLSDPRTAATSI